MSYLEQLKKLKEPTLATATTDTSPSGSSVSTYSDRISEINNHIEAAEERAAIMEYNGGLSRAEAERHAIEVHLKPYFFHTTDGEGTFLTKCQSIEEVKEVLSQHFGKKLLEVRRCH